LLERLDNPEKRWKFSEADLAERGYWDKYMDAYEQALSATSTRHAPWHITPVDHKWGTRWIASELVTRAIRSLPLRLLKPSRQKQAALSQARKLLEKE
jgi:polyphosphate kinase 2 (PPK2 family)